MFLTKVISFIYILNFASADQEAKKYAFDAYEITPEHELDKMVSEDDMIFFLAMDYNHGDTDNFLNAFNSVGGELIYFKY